MKQGIFFCMLATVCVPAQADKGPQQVVPQESAVPVSAILVPWKPNFASLPATCSVETLSRGPYILCIHNFITDEENSYIKQKAKPLLKRSVVVEAGNPSAVSQNRTSSSAFLENMNDDITIGVRQRAADFVNTTINSIEQLQVVYYRDGQKYEPHYDYFDRNLATAKDVIGSAGQRSATFLVYLNDVEPGAGGETLFPKVQGGLKVRPQKNMAVFWFNVLPSGQEDDRTLHGGLPIQDGEKWAINIWVRESKLVNAVP